MQADGLESCIGGIGVDARGVAIDPVGDGAVSIMIVGIHAGIAAHLVAVPYDKINLLEYGQRVDRRYVAAALLSPLFLLAKKRTHFLTVGYSDDENRQQAMVFRVSKDDIRMMLVSLEARTGRKVEFQDDDARKAGKG